MRGKGLRFSLMVGVLLATAGCSHDIRPTVQDQGLYLTKVHDQNIQIVADPEFQQLTVKDVPLRSSNWRGQSFTIPIGKPLTDGIYRYASATFDKVRIGDRLDGQAATATVILTGATVELWIDDDSSFVKQMLFTPTYYTSTVDAHSKVVLSGMIARDGGKGEAFQIVGSGVKSLVPARMDADVFEETTGSAAADVSKQVTNLLRNGPAQK